MDFEGPARALTGGLSVVLQCQCMLYTQLIAILDRETGCRGHVVGSQRAFASLPFFDLLACPVSACARWHLDRYLRIVFLCIALGDSQ